MGKRDLLMLKSDSFFSSIYNKKVLIENRLNYSEKKRLLKNKSLKLDYEQKEHICFVLGNGPSTNLESLKKIKDFPKMTVNFFHKGGEHFHSDYHLIVDPAFYLEEEYKRYTLKLVQREKHTKMIFNSEIVTNLYGKYDYPDNVYCINANVIQYGDHLSVDMCKPMTSSPNVIPLAIQCVIHMGYKEIYLLGCEFGLYGIPGSAGGHFYEERGPIKKAYADSPENLIKCGLVHMHHRAIIQYCTTHGIIIKNLSPLTNLGEYNLDDLDHILEMANKHE